MLYIIVECSNKPLIWTYSQTSLLSKGSLSHL
jgi:hypothetical protein